MDIREEQIRLGRKLAGQETEAKPVYRKSVKPVKAVKKPQGHEAFLKMLEQSQAEIEVEIISSGEKVRGIVKHSDHYTISVKPEGKGTRVFFKHDISSFEPTDANREQE